MIFLSGYFVEHINQLKEIAGVIFRIFYVQNNTTCE